MCRHAGFEWDGSTKGFWKESSKTNSRLVSWFANEPMAKETQCKTKRLLWQIAHILRYLKNKTVCGTTCMEKIRHIGEDNVTWQFEWEKSVGKTLIEDCTEKILQNFIQLCMVCSKTVMVDNKLVSMFVLKDHDMWKNKK